mmetsp:Transcript_14994/g.42487  ORF Transcript_14994/g.42487 Transcript_14994/m.42487 type:complete len:258 (-) Transcript_14994:101-874(-)
MAPDNKLARLAEEWCKIFQGIFSAQRIHAKTALDMETGDVIVCAFYHVSMCGRFSLTPAACLRFLIHRLAWNGNGTVDVEIELIDQHPCVDPNLFVTVGDVFTLEGLSPGRPVVIGHEMEEDTWIDLEDAICRGMEEDELFPQVCFDIAHMTDELRHVYPYFMLDHRYYGDDSQDIGGDSEAEDDGADDRPAKRRKLIPALGGYREAGKLSHADCEAVRDACMDAAVAAAVLHMGDGKKTRSRFYPARPPETHLLGA